MKYLLFYRLAKLRPHYNQRSVTLWGEMVQGPYGGGSQVFKAIAGELTTRGYRVYNNSYHDSDGHILNSAFFDIAKAEYVIRKSRKKPRVVHRIDGPISIYRNTGIEVDKKIFELNARIATVTAFQSKYSWDESLRLGLVPKNPLIIRNACDLKYFYKKPRKDFKLSLPIKLINTSWSNNWLKGFDTLEYLDKNLDFSRYQFTFVGRSPIAFKNIQHIEPVGSKRLGEYLRSADIFICPSVIDSASNSLLEAINCGLPVIYANRTGHAEIAGSCGLPFNAPNEIPARIDEIVANYELYYSRLQWQTISQMVDSYLQCLGFGEGVGLIHER